MNLLVKPESRGAAIAAMLRERDFLSVEELAGQFEVTTQTIRRDINGLCEQGIARRLHGGIGRPTGRGNVAFQERRVLNRAAKMAIGRTLAARIPDGASVSFGIGTTPQMVAEALMDHQGLKIVTNNLPIALTAAQNPTFEIAIAGGLVRNNDLDVCGSAIEGFFGAYKVDFAVFGVGGVDEDGSLLDFTHEEVQARQAMRANCRRSFLVLDATKFGRPAHVHGGRIDQVDTVFCETALPQAIRDLIAGSRTSFVSCSDEIAGDASSG